jgi:hypothetical protein
MADAAYGLWPLVVLNTLLFAAFGLSFFRPRTNRDWRAMSAYTALARTEEQAVCHAIWPRMGRICSAHTSFCSQDWRARPHSVEDPEHSGPSGRNDEHWHE